MEINKKLLKYFFGALFLVEYFSLIGHIYPLVSAVCFFLIVALTAGISIYKIEYGLFILLAELFIGSFGRLFAFDIFGFSLSLRIALWLVFLFIWLAKEMKALYQKKGRIKELFSIATDNNSIVYAFFALFVFIIWGLVSGILNQAAFKNVFLDFNGWLYFALFFPLFQILQDKEKQKILWQIFLFSALWLSLKTFFLLYIFSHNILSIVPEFYAWIRDTRIGEITQMQGGFYRIFMQSHIFVLIAFFLSFLIFIKNFQAAQWKISKANIFFYLLTVLFLAVNLITLSRSNWLGLAFGLGMFGLFIFFVYGFKKSLLVFLIALSSGIFSVGLIAAIVKFPYPDPTGGFSTSELLAERAKQISGEAGVSSRWSLLPVLWQEIKTAPVLGKGFGASVSYKSSDPRVLEKNPDGYYTTAAFEWGWLDIWLKLGLLGLIAYLFLLGLLMRIFIKNIILFKAEFLRGGADLMLMPAVFIGLGAIVIINFFSPYLNHPLGIGYLMIAATVAQTISQNFQNRTFLNNP